MLKRAMAVLILLSCPFFAFSAAETRLLREPSTSGARVAFVYAGDIWTASIDGGEATRLTSHPGLEISPRFSPNGELIAFTGEYDGNQDVYLVPWKGGEPQRLTYHPDDDLVEGWTPDGKSILFSSPRSSSRKRYNKLFTIPAQGGFPQALPMPMAEMGSFSPDGTQIAYTPINNREYRWWKNYRGGQTTPIWVFDLAHFGSTEIPHENAPDRFPMWVGRKIYFVSDREDATMNLYSFDPATSTISRITKFDQYDVKWASAGGGLIVFEYSGFLYKFDPDSVAISKISIHVPSEGLQTRPRYIQASRFISNASLSPTGMRAAFEAYGEVLTVPAQHGDIRNLTNTSSACERYPSWSPDGQSIAFLSDQSGEYEIVIADQKGARPSAQIGLGKPGFFYSPVWSPDGTNIALTDNHLNLYLVNVRSHALSRVDTDTYAFEERSLAPCWSPDGKWLAYSKRLANYYRSIYLYNLESGEKVQVTDGMSDAVSPVFDKSGKYLYFAASTNSGLATYWLDLSSFIHRLTRNIYAVALRDDLPSPLTPKSDEEAPAADTPKPTADRFRIDLKDLGRRIMSLPIPAQHYAQLWAGKEGILFLKQIGPETEQSSLIRFDLGEGKTSPVISGVESCEVSRDGTKALYRSKDVWGIIDSMAPAKIGDGRIGTEKLEIRIEPRDAWRQMFLESWRVNRDFFYDAGMHGNDWAALKKKYEQWLPDVSHRTDLNYLIGEMIGELHVGHAYIDYGDLPKQEKVDVGLLGADYEIVGNRYRIKKIYRALNWNPEVACPLDGLEGSIDEGDYLLKVNGVELTAPTNIFKFFEKTTGRRTMLTVNSAPVLEGSRSRAVVPIADESPLRTRAWVEDNRARVAELSGGRVGYVYIPNTGWGGLRSFDRYYYAQIDKEAVVIDERFNSGGWLPDYFIDMLDRPLLCYWVPRAGKVYSSPAGSVYGPRVMLINEYSASGGDALAYYFKEQGLGKLVGKRTWGGLVCVYDYPDLMDGGYISAPRLRILSPEGKWVVENVGVYPDVEVEMAPALVIAGKDPQLEQAVALVLKELEENPPPKPKIPAFPIREHK